MDKSIKLFYKSYLVMGQPPFAFSVLLACPADMKQLEELSPH